MQRSLFYATIAVVFGCTLLTFSANVMITLEETSDAFRIFKHLDYCCLQNHCSLTIICCLEFQSAGTVGSSHEDSRGQDVGLLILWKEVHNKIFLEEAQKTPHRQDLDSHLRPESYSFAI